MLLYILGLVLKCLPKLTAQIFRVYSVPSLGVGKTMLAEVAAEATSLSFYFYQMHRDTRVQEMVGDSVIVREVSE